MKTQHESVEKVDMELVREVFRLGREFEDAVSKLEDLLDESIGTEKVLNVCKCDKELSIETDEVDDLALCLRLGNCLEDSWASDR